MENKFYDLCQKVVAEAGYELLRVTWKNRELCFYIKKEGGIDHIDCENVTRLVEPIVDANDRELGDNYSLSVSSEGIDGKDWE